MDFATFANTYQGLIALASLVVAIVGIAFARTAQQSHYGSGDNVGGNKIISLASRHSAEQSLKLWPESMGGIDTLNLDNAARLEQCGSYDEQHVTLLMDSTSLRVPKPRPGERVDYPDGTSVVINPDESPAFKVEGLRMMIQPKIMQKYVFSLSEQPRHVIVTDHRRFVVSLATIKKHHLPEVAVALEYVFNINEII
ncbi:MAG: hypothetical protein WC030_01905 [Candidatus Paceibacterota bacterium]